jgi:probable rRNA maturation factor
MIFLHIDDNLQLTDTQITIIAWLERAAQETLLHAEVAPEAELSLVLSNDLRLRELNHQFLNIDEPTDVLSFPSNETDPETAAPYLGDVIISYERASTQAQAAGHSLKDELELLVVHGVLHLLGYDHASTDEQQAMWAVQSDILEQLGSNISAP